MLCSPVALHNIQDSILAQTEPVADFPIRLAFTDKLEDFGREAVCLHALTGSPPEYHAPFAGSRYARANPLAQ